MPGSEAELGVARSVSMFSHPTCQSTTVSAGAASQVHCTSSQTQDGVSSGPVPPRSEAGEETTWYLGWGWGDRPEPAWTQLPQRHLFLTSPINYSISNGGGGFWKPMEKSSIPSGNSPGGP